jgi:hypothetical protein
MDPQNLESQRALLPRAHAYFSRGGTTLPQFVCVPLGSAERTPRAHIDAAIVGLPFARRDLCHPLRVESSHAHYIRPATNQMIIRDIPTTRHSCISGSSTAIISHFRGIRLAQLYDSTPCSTDQGVLLSDGR